MADKPWTVLPHGALQALEPNLWRVQGALPSMPLQRVMTIARRADGDLVVYSPIAMDAAEMAQIDALGKVAYIVVPNGWHRLDAPQFTARYPDAKILVPAAARKRVAKAVTVHGALDAMPPDAQVALTPVAGTRDAEAMMIVSSANGAKRTSVVVADTIFNMPHRRGVGGFVLKHVMQSSGPAHVSRIARLFLIKDKPAFAAQLTALATPELARVIVAHEDVVSDRPADALREVAASVS